MAAALGSRDEYAGHPAACFAYDLSVPIPQEPVASPFPTHSGHGGRIEETGHPSPWITFMRLGNISLPMYDMEVKKLPPPLPGPSQAYPRSSTSNTSVEQRDDFLK